MTMVDEMPSDLEAEQNILSMKEKILEHVAQLQTEEYRKELQRLQSEISALKEENRELRRAAESKEITAAGLSTKWKSEYIRLRSDNIVQKQKIEALEVRL